MAVSTKNFRKRNAILAYLQQTKDHPSAEMIFNQLKPEIADPSIGTVYRNLTVFRQQGLAACIATVGGVERFDGNTAAHVHFICTECGSVVDLPGIHVPEELNTAVARSSGGQVENCQLSFTGKCSDCCQLN